MQSISHSLLYLIILLCLSSPLIAAQELSVATQNVQRFFDDRNDGNREKVISKRKYQQRIQRLVEKIVTTLQKPDVLALQEVENINILKDVRDRLKTYGLNYRSVLFEGHDPSGIDIGFLVKNTYRINQKTQLFKTSRYGEFNNYLFTRPPLMIEVCQELCVSVINLHLRSMRGLRSSKKGKRVALKRRLQAEKLASWVNTTQEKHPTKKLILTGDFNALPNSDRFVDVFGTIKGDPDRQTPRWKSKDLIDKDLIDVSLNIPLKNRFSFIYRKQRQQLDYLLISSTLVPHFKQAKFTTIDYSFADHAALIARFELGPVERLH